MALFGRRTTAVAMALTAFAVSGCAQQPIPPREIPPEIAARTEGADCETLRMAMSEARAEYSTAQNTRAVGDAARAAGMVASFIPGVSLIGFAANRAGSLMKMAGRNAAENPRLLYEESHRVYSAQDCEPEVPFGE